MRLDPGDGDAEAAPGPWLSAAHGATPAATEAFKKSRRDLPLSISTSLSSSTRPLAESPGRWLKKVLTRSSNEKLPRHGGSVVSGR